MLKISILMYDPILHNDTGVNSKVPLAYLPPEGGGLRSGAVQDPIYPTVWWSALPTNCSSLSTDGFGEVWHATASATWT